MKKSAPLGVVAAGQHRRSVLAKMPLLTEHLGPVKAQSLRLASQLVNTLRAGYPVHHYEELEKCRLVLICVPAARLSRVLAELAAAPLQWKGKAVLVCGVPPACAFDGLSARGVATGSLTPIELSDERRFLVEGDRPAVLAARRFLDAGREKVIEIHKSSQALCEASTSFATCLLLPLLDASVICLREAGLTRGQSGSIVEKMVQRSLRSYLKGGRKAWKGPLASSDRAAMARQLEMLRRTDAGLARLFFAASLQALNLFGRDARWLEEARSASA